MNDSTSKPSPSSRRSGIRRWPRPLIFCGALIALVAAFYAEEDWRGRRDWNQYRKAVEARGDHLEFQAYIPKPVPDGENFAAAPEMQILLRPDYLPFTNDLYAKVADYITETNIEKDRGHRHFLDLVAWEKASVANQTGELQRELKAANEIRLYDRHYTSSQLAARPRFETDQTDLAARAAAAPAVLEGMKPDEATFTALSQASARPSSRFSLQYNLEDPWQKTQIAHLAHIKAICSRLNLHACAELAAGQPDKALPDVKLILALADSVKSEPFLISYLVRVSCFQLAIQPVWEGLAENRWTGAQLSELESCFQHYDFLTDLIYSLKVERISGIHDVDEIRKNGLGTAIDLGVMDIDATTPQKKLLNAISRIIPAGWYDQERLNYCKTFDALMEGTFVLAQEQVCPGQLASNHFNLSQKLPDLTSQSLAHAILHHRIIAARVLDYLSKLPNRAAVPQVIANQAAVACALERYRLANGQFPDKLETLAPQFISRLPNDVLTGRPYKYRRTDDGQFVLYSVGWNLKDDGGVPGKRLFDDKEGDWVWDYPAQ